MGPVSQEIYILYVYFIFKCHILIFSEYFIEFCNILPYIHSRWLKYTYKVIMLNRFITKYLLLLLLHSSFVQYIKSSVFCLW